MHHEVIGNFMKEHFQLTDDHLVPKSLPEDRNVISEDNPVELKDLDLLTMRLSKLIFGNTGQ